MKSLKERTEIQQAHLEGVETEYLALKPDGKGWSYNGCDFFNWTEYDFRIKEEVMEIWIVIDSDDDGVFMDRLKSVALEQCNNGDRVVKFIETEE